MLRMSNAKFIWPLTIISSFISCSGQPTPTPVSNAPVETVELFLSRTSFSDTEFEHYKLFSGQLFVECGVSRHGRLIPKKQDVLALTHDQTPNNADELIRLAASDVLSKLQGKSLDQPGTNRSPGDPGQFLLTIQAAGARTEIKTSLDSVVNDNFGFGQDLATLGELIRGSAPTMCNNQQFYGLIKRKS